MSRRRDWGDLPLTGEHGQSEHSLVRRRDWPVALLLVVLGGWFGRNLGGGLSVDEAIYAETAAALFRGDLYMNPTHLVAPTAKYFMGVGILAAGDPVGARAVTALFALLTVYLTYRIGDLLGGRAVGTLAAAIVGGTHFFAFYAVRAMLDVPLACFFLGTLYATLRWDRERGRRALVAVGVLAAAAVTTKAYGVLYAAPPAAFVAARLSAERGWREAARELRYPVAGAAATLALVFLPYVFVPHPPIPARFDGPIATVASIPVLSNFAYIAGAFFLQNVAHASGGHAVEVGSTVYQYPPVWTHLYWLFERGGPVYVGGLALTLVGGLYGSLRERRPTAALIVASVVVPFTALSLLTVKFPRYVLPLYPLIAVGGALYGARVGEYLRDVLAETRVVPRGRVAILAVAGVVLVLAAAAPPSPFLASAQDPIRTDTRYDEVAAFIEDRAADSGPLAVLTYSGSIRIGLEYYLGNRSDVTFYHFQLNQGFNESRAAEYRTALEDGEIQLVVWERDAARATDSFDRFVRERGRRELSLRETPGGEHVQVYAFTANESAGA